MGSPYEGADALLEHDHDHDGDGTCQCGVDHSAGLGEQFYQMANMLGPEFPLVRGALEEFCTKQGIDPAVLDGIDDRTTWESIFMDAALPNGTTHVDWANNEQAAAASKWLSHAMLASLKPLFALGQVAMDLGIRLHPNHVNLLDQAVEGLSQMFANTLALQTNPLHTDDDGFCEQQANSDVPLITGPEAAKVIPTHEGAFTAWVNAYLARTEAHIAEFEDEMRSQVGNIDPATATAEQYAEVETLAQTLQQVFHDERQQAIAEHKATPLADVAVESREG
jgi:hypothetical protein